MRIKEAMTTAVATIDADAAVKAAADRMKDAGTGLLPVVENKKPVGVLTDRDVAVKVVSENRDPLNTTVRQVMTSGVHTVYEDQDARDLVTIMIDLRISLVVVTDRDGRVTGTCALAELLIATNPAFDYLPLESVSELVT